MSDINTLIAWRTQNEQLCVECCNIITLYQHCHRGESAASTSSFSHVNKHNIQSREFFWHRVDTSVTIMYLELGVSSSITLNFVSFGNLLSISDFIEAQFSIISTISTGYSHSTLICRKCGPFSIINCFVTLVKSYGTWWWIKQREG